MSREATVHTVTRWTAEGAKVADFVTRKSRSGAAAAFMVAAHAAVRSLAMLDTRAGWTFCRRTRALALAFERGEVVGAEVDFCGARVVLAAAQEA